ncbi:hypothetical protein BT67DRAFT_114001 [Trichocladium antarcticum]|uniref:Uncharacterized protein n=1 Tax=Trichocladium antarcticum TaxID=1450529 RepID=A0AAN6ZHD5_9PEZI|nr:hypothetical protein BT67DRAFT_114001 [Trichocladium antarcticum]
MAFRDSITALLDTYANCISLLKALKHGHDENTAAGTQHHHLRKSLRSDRSSVRRAYSSRLSEAGSRFEKGDGRAVSALTRVLKRLKDSITGLLRLSSNKDGPSLDYQSLMTLSNASRADAISAIDGLSRRLGRPSRSSVAGSSSSKTSKTSLSSQRKHRPPSKQLSSKQTKDRLKKSSSNESPPPPKERKGISKQVKSEAKRSPSSTEAPGTKPRSRSPRPVSQSLRKTKTAVPNRISFMSFSSDSTKLGEIPQRKLQSAYYATATDPDGDEYNVRPTFPLTSYTTEVKERRFWGVFRRRR